MPQMLEIIPLDKFKKELLRQVLRLAVVIAFTANERIKWEPIGMAEFLQSLIGHGRAAVFRTKHNAPMRGCKPLPPGRLSERQVFLHGATIRVFGHSRIL